MKKQKTKTKSKKNSMKKGDVVIFNKKGKKTEMKIIAVYPSVPQ